MSNYEKPRAGPSPPKAWDRTPWRAPPCAAALPREYELDRTFKPPTEECSASWCGMHNSLVVLWKTACLLPFPGLHDIAGRLARRFLEYLGEELARSRRAADVQAVHAVFHKAEIALPTEIAEHEAQAFELRRGQRGVIDIEHMPGAVSQRFRLALLVGVLLRLHQRGHHQRPEGLLRPGLLIQAPRLEGDVGQRADGRRRRFGEIVRIGGQ